jgi:hypothetical protein
MKTNPNNPNLPLVSASADGLGVREPPNRYADIDLDSNEMVVLNGRGMSVAAHWSHLPPHRIPRRLGDDNNGAKGSDELCCWVMGEGDFISEKINTQIELAIKSNNPSGGNFVPCGLMSLEDFQHALKETSTQWTVDET